MKVATKICGVSDRACMDAAADGGAAVGCGTSPRM